MTDAVLEERPPKTLARSPQFLRTLRAPKGHAAVKTSLAQATELQRLSCKMALALEADLDSSTDAKTRAVVAQALRQAMAAYESASDLVRIAKNKPLPGSLRPESKPRAKAKAGSVSFQEAPAPVQETSPKPPVGGS